MIVNIFFFLTISTNSFSFDYSLYGCDLTYNLIYKMTALRTPPTLLSIPGFVLLPSRLSGRGPSKAYEGPKQSYVKDLPMPLPKP
jgi:hypothetical protein